MADLSNQTFGNNVSFPVYNALIPKEGPKVLPYTCNFGTNSSYVIDLQNAQASGKISLVQTVYIDNSLNAQPVTVTSNTTNQKVTAPPYYQGYFPILSQNPPRFTISSAGTVSVGIMLMNIPVQAQSWSSSQNAFAFDTNGYLYVDDPNLASIVSGGYASVKDFLNGNGDTTRKAKAGNLSWSGSVTATATTIVTGAPSFFITELELSYSNDLAISVAGDLTVTVKDGTNVIFTSVLYVPATGGTAVGNREFASLSGMNYNSQAATSPLTLNLSSALTSGKISYNIFGGLTAEIA